MKTDKKNNNNRKVINDIILIIFLCIVTGIACFFLYFKDDETSEMQLQVLVDGKLINTYFFEDSDNVNEEIILETGNTVIVENGHVYMKYADCPDGLCIKQGKISRVGESIICLPHKLVIRIVDQSEDKTYSDAGVEDGLDVIPR